MGTNEVRRLALVAIVVLVLADLIAAWLYLQHGQALGSALVVVTANALGAIVVVAGRGSDRRPPES